MTRKDSVVIGCGYWGKNIIANVFNEGRLSSVVDFNKNLEKEYLEKFKLQPTSLKEIESSSNIKNIFIVTPAETHYELTANFLQLGKNCFVEKPLCLDLAEAERLGSLSKKNSKVLMVGHLLQYHPCYSKLREIVLTKGEKIISVKSTRKSFGKLRKNENVLWSFAPHDISMILGILEGEVKVHGTSKTNLFDEKIYDAIDAAFRIGHTEAKLSLDWSSTVKEQKIEVAFKDEIYVFEDSTADFNKKLYRYNVGISQESLQSKNSLEKEYIEVNSDMSPLEYEIKHFFDCVDNEQEPLTNYLESLKVIKVLNALDE